MNLPYYIAEKTSTASEGSFAKSVQKVAVISIATGLISLLLAFMVLGGFQQTIKEKIYSFSGHLLVSSYTLSTSFEESSIKIDAALQDYLDNSPLVKRWQPFALKAGLLKTDEDVQGIILKGVDHLFDTTFFVKNIKEGRFPTIGQEAYSTEVAISKKTSNYLRLGVGDKVLIYFVQNPPRYRNLTITGIYETGLEEFDEKIVLGDIALVRRINDWEQQEATGVEVFVNRADKIEDAQDELFDTLPSDFYVENVHEKYIQIFEWLFLLNRNVAIFLALILFVACFSMVSILLILIMERTQMIGILKALGAKNRLIRKIFMQSGLRLVFRGMGWGNLIGLGMGALQYYFKIIPLDPYNYYMDVVPVQFDWQIIFILNLIVLTLIGISLLVPVRIISSISPLKAIRFD